MGWFEDSQRHEQTLLKITVLFLLLTLPGEQWKMCFQKTYVYTSVLVFQYCRQVYDNCAWISLGEDPWLLHSAQVTAQSWSMPIQRSVYLCTYRMHNFQEDHLLWPIKRI